MSAPHFVPDPTGRFLNLVSGNGQVLGRFAGTTPSLAAQQRLQTALTVALSPAESIPTESGENAGVFIIDASDGIDDEEAAAAGKILRQRGQEQREEKREEKRSRGKKPVSSPEPEIISESETALFFDLDSRLAEANEDEDED